MREIPLAGSGRVALIDDLDYEAMSAWKWQLSSGRPPFYARRIVRRVVAGERRCHEVTMHSAILTAPVGFVVDHINGDGLDNRRENLRIATPLQNNMNRPGIADGTSKFKGVSRLRDRWRAQIRIGGRSVHIGVFLLEVDAAKAYDKIARLNFGEFAYVNFPTSPAPTFACNEYLACTTRKYENDKYAPRRRAPNILTR